VLTNGNRELAAALKARGKKVGIFDADLHGPNIPALVGCPAEARSDYEQESRIHVSHTSAP
jgi:Mrp family chromosome partitioning ATPase